MYIAITQKTMGKVNSMALVLYINRNWLMLLFNLKKKPDFSKFIDIITVFSLLF